MNNPNNLSATIIYEDDELFYKVISGVFTIDIYTIISENSNLKLHYEYDYLEDVGYIIVSNNEKFLLKMRSPKLSYCSGSGPAVAQKATSNQKQIDFWLKLFAENLEFIAMNSMRKLNVEVKYILAYKTCMYWSSRDVNDNCVYIHPYLKENYPEQYEEVKKENEANGSVVLVDILERKQREQFEKYVAK